MLEGLAAWVLKTYIGKYVNVNPDKLSIGLLSGVVELENVQLNCSAFNTDRELPFEIKYGYAGKIKLNVSLSTLRYSPWVLAVEKLFIVIGPKDLEAVKTTPRQTETEGSEAEKVSDKWSFRFRVYFMNKRHLEIHINKKERICVQKRQTYRVTSEKVTFWNLHKNLIFNQSFTRAIYCLTLERMVIF